MQGVLVWGTCRSLIQTKIGFWFHLYLSRVSTVHIVSVYLSYQVAIRNNILWFVILNLAGWGTLILMILSDSVIKKCADFVYASLGLEHLIADSAGSLLGSTQVADCSNMISFVIIIFSMSQIVFEYLGVNEL